MDRERPLWLDRLDEVDRLVGPQPRPVYRHQQGLDRLGWNVEGIAGVIQAIIDDVAKVGAVGLPVVDEGMPRPDRLHLETRGGALLAGGHRDDRQATGRLQSGDPGVDGRVDGDPQPGQSEDIDMIDVLMGDEHRVRAEQGARLAPDSRVDD